MNRIVVASFASALFGAVFGASVVGWVAHNDAPAPDALGAGSATPGASGAELARRLDAVEQTLASTQARAHVLPTLAAAGNPGGTTEPAGLDEAVARVDNPVFEAAVLDIIDRAEEARHAERGSAVRSERRRPRNPYWANDLTMRLGLTPAQTERLVAIQNQLEQELQQQRREPEDAAALREKRNAERAAIRKRAEEQLRGVLAPRQLAAYETLDDQLKLYRP